MQSIESRSVVSFRPKGHDRPRRPRLIDEVERGAEQAGQGIRQRKPFVVGLFFRVRLEPGPQLDAGAALLGAIPGPCSPALGIPPPQAEPQVQLPRPDMLQYLPQRSREVSEVVRLELRQARVRPEVEAREERGLRERFEIQLFMVFGSSEAVGEEK